MTKLSNTRIVPLGKACTLTRAVSTGEQEEQGSPLFYDILG